MAYEMPSRNFGSLNGAFVSLGVRTVMPLGA